MGVINIRGVRVSRFIQGSAPHKCALEFVSLCLYIDQEIEFRVQVKIKSNERARRARGGEEEEGAGGGEVSPRLMVFPLLLCVN